MKKVIIDSSVWISSFIEEDILHYESKRKIAKYISKKVTIILPEIVIFEVLNILYKKKFPDHKIKYIHDYFLTNKECKIVTIDFQILLQRLKQRKNRLNLKSLDCIIALYFDLLSVNFFESNDRKLLNQINKLIDENKRN